VLTVDNATVKAHTYNKVNIRSHQKLG